MTIPLEGSIPPVDLKSKENQVKGLQQGTGEVTLWKTLRDYKKDESRKMTALALPSTSTVVKQMD